jgi:signal transduction histidine kinase
MLAPFRSPGVRPYLYGIFGVLVTTLLRSPLHSNLGEHLSFSFNFLAVFVAAWTGGIWPALVTAILGVITSEYYFSDSIKITSLEEFLDLTFFVLVSVVIGILSEISLRAHKRAKQAEQDKDNFMAAVAHEMRSPLSVIYYASSLSRLARQEQPTDQLDVIDRQVHHLNVMIEDLLDVSRVTRGKIKLNRRTVDAAAIVAGAVERARPLIERHKHQLKVNISPEPMTLFVDPSRIEQVISNLLTNAAKYTPDGGKIVVSVRADGEQAAFSVRDNGIGIAPEELPRVFDLFMQAEAARDRRDGGLGIGLALARKIAEMHGGTMQAVSGGEGQGSEFICTLPLEQAARVTAELASI